MPAHGRMILNRVPSALQARAARLTGRGWFWIAVVGVLFAAPLLRGLLQGRPPAPPPVLGSFPGFALIAERGASFTEADLGRRAFIANLLCSSCRDAQIAPETMAALQHRTRNLGDALWLVSFSQDADAADLATIRRRYRAGQRWILLAGVPAEAKPLFTEAGALLLVDGRLRIRGRYRADQPDDVARILRDAALIAAMP